MRALLLTDSDVFAGTERHVLDLAVGLAALDGGRPIVPTVSAPSPSALEDRCSESRIQFLALPKRNPLIDRGNISELADRLVKREVDLLHAHNGKSLLTALLARGRAGRGAVVYTQHFLQPARLGRKGIWRMASRFGHRWMKQRIDQTIAISHAVADEMLGRAEVLSDRLSVVHHGIADPRSLVKSQRDAIRQSQGIRPDQLLLVCSARLEPEKDISTLVEAMAAVVRQIPGAVCLIAGEGSLHASIESQIQACGLTQSVRLMGFRSDVPDLLCAADLFVLPALAEPFGLSIVEAMAFGLPVIATNAGGPREIVEANASGLFVKPGSASDTARAIIGLLGDSRRRAEMGQKARRRYQENFSLERMATQTALIYQKALSTAAGAGGESEARAAELTRGIA